MGLGMELHGPDPAPSLSMKSPICPYCGNPAVFYKSSVSFHRGVDYGPLWACKPCRAWVGCHPKSRKPLGRLANARLRAAKMDAHQVFDQLWRFGSMNRQAAYKWLAGELGIPWRECHIGMFDVETCERVVEIVMGALSGVAQKKSGAGVKLLALTDE